jgi:hypothetical protein
MFFSESIAKIKKASCQLTRGSIGKTPLSDKSDRRWPNLSKGKANGVPTIDEGTGKALKQG